MSFGNDLLDLDALRKWKEEQEASQAPVPTRQIAEEANPISPIVKNAIASRLGYDQELLRGGYENAGEANLISGLGKAANQIGAGIARTEVPKAPVFDEISANANAPIKMISDMEGMRSKREASDPNSPRAQVYKSIFGKAFPKYQKELSSLSYGDAKEIGDFISASEKQKTQAEENRLLREQNRNFKEEELGIRKAGLAKEKSMPEESRKSLFQSQQGMKAVDGMKQALSNGNWTFSLIGDNDFTRNARIAAEMYGRLQSGGAINKDEEARFMAMLPKPTDSAEQQAKKIQDAMSYFQDRVGSYGKAPASLPQQGGGNSKAGTIIEYQGSHYRVGADGDTLEPL